MITQKNTAIIIPARLAATRLPNKPLIKIHGKPMIHHVWERACESNLGKVVVATDSKEIEKVIEDNGGTACLTSMDHQSGTDRIYEALQKCDNENNIEYIINLQGDLPNIDTSSLITVLQLLENKEVNIGTLVVKINDETDLSKSQIVKALCMFQENQRSTKALDFQRLPKDISIKNLYHHIGIYSYTRESLSRFVNLDQTKRERDEKLEQLRALEDNMHIEAGLIDFLPLGVDTPEDLEVIKDLMRK